MFVSRDVRERNRMKEAGAGCGIFTILMGMVVVVMLGGVGIWGLRVYFAEEIGRGDAEIQIQSAESRISHYNYFFNLCVSVQNAETAIDSETERLNQTTDEFTRNTILTNISASKTTRMNGINTYNADASKDYTSGQFLASNLPYSLPTTPYEAGGPKTTCTARG